MRYVAVIFAALLLTSCSVKKRTYRDGYYIDWAFNKKTTAPVKKAEVIKTPEVKEEIPIEIVSSRTTPDINSTLLVPQKREVLLMDTCGDVITFKSGDQVTARVVEITLDKIKYKRCDNLDGPTFVVNKTTVDKIKYVNGVEEKIEAPIATTTPTSSSNFDTYDRNTKPKELNPKALWSLICVAMAPVSYGTGIIAGLILAIFAIREIKRNPDRYKGMVLAKIALITAIILLSLIALLIVLFSLF